MSRLQIRWPHVLAFLFGAFGIWGKFLADAVQGGQSVNVALLGACLTGTAGLIWALAQETVLPDITGGSGTTKRALGGSGAPPPMPPANSRAETLLPGLLVAACLAMALVWTVSLTGCTQLQAAFPVLDKIEKIVLADLQAGKGAEAIEADVAQALAGQAGVDVVLAVNDAILFLIDMGVIPANVIPQAKEVLHVEHVKLEARGIHR
jgi:hypothetical protein